MHEANSPSPEPPAPVGPGDQAGQTDRLAMPSDSKHLTPRLAFPVVGMGASAGGLEAFGEFFNAMPPDSGMAFVLIQHLPPDRESMLVEILSKRTAMPVAQVAEGLEVEPDHVYIIRPGHTLTLHEGKLHLGEPVEKPGHRRPVDDFFRSLAEEQRERAICIIMSGMGSNGTAGAQSIKAVGGLCIAQEPASAKFDTMPKSLIDSGMADFVLKPEDIPEILIRYASHPYATGTSPADLVARRERRSLTEILAVMRARTRHDFTGYKKPTLVRRIQRRMGLSQLTRMDDYVRSLRQNPAEVTALADDLMVHVTGFFRDADCWDSLRKNVLHPLISQRDEHASIRAWVTACSSGEEAYTLAMLLVEEAEAAGKHFDIKIFATDTAERSLAHARGGNYPGGIESDISPERLARFFEKDEATYRVRKDLRELVVFAPQNVLQDPPFSRLDLCTCRNLLIYLEPDIQRRVLALLHFGLREGGALLLGNSETISGVEEMFEPIDKKHRIYRRIGPTRHGAGDFPLPRSLSEGGSEERSAPRPLSRSTLSQLTIGALLEHHTPVAIVVDSQQHIVYFHGQTERFLDQPHGEPTRDLMSLVRESVRGAVRIALSKAVRQNAAARALDGVIDTESGRQRIQVTAAPLEPKGASSYYLISFETVPEPAATPPSTEGWGADERRALEEELRRVRDELQNNVEELQTSNEEMKASNEEVTSINEELQSSNEELETSKEELQSLNEELTTVNAQLQTKMEELEAMTNDLSSLLSSTDIAVVFLDTQFQIRRFTPAIRDLMELIPSDVGRPLNDLARKFTDPHLMDDVKTVLEKLVPSEQEVSSQSGRTYIRRALPYRTTDDRIGGVVVTFVDITQRHQVESALRESEQRHRLIIQSVKEYAILTLDTSGRFTTWPPGAERVIGFSEADAIGQSWEMLFTPEDRKAGEPAKKLKTALESGSLSDERWCMRKDGGQFWCSGVISAVMDSDGKVEGFVKVIRDNNDHKRAEVKLQQATVAAEAANEAKDQFLANISHELRTPLSAMLLWANMLSEAQNPGPAQLREGLEAIRRSAEAQRELIEELLDTSRISAGKLRLEPREIDLAGVMHSAVEAVLPAAKIKDLHVEEHLDAKVGTVNADPHRIQQIVWNLLSNAVKFTPAGGRIIVDVKRDGIEVEILVTDTGRGISPEFLPHVFDRFGQAETSPNSQGGLGLGLTIAKQLVELHGGNISAQSEGHNRGAKFTVRLPLPEIVHAHAGRRRPKAVAGIPEPELANRHILLVEDESETRRALVALLSDAGARVTAADSTASALEAFLRETPDLILSDIGLPEGDGYELMRKIRAIEKKRKSIPVPAMALTAHAFETDRRKAARSGFQRYVTKPTEPAQLIAQLAALLPAR